MVTEPESIEINRTKSILLTREGEYALSKNEVLLLELFYTNPNEVFSNDEISTACWPGRVVSPSSVPVAIKRVRDLLKKAHLKSKIITHKGEGYSFSFEDSAEIKFTESECNSNDTHPSIKNNNIKIIISIFIFTSAYLLVFLSKLEWSEIITQYDSSNKIKIITNSIDEINSDLSKYNRSRFGSSISIAFWARRRWKLSS